MPPENGVGRHEGDDAGQHLASHAMTQFRAAPTLVVVQTQSSLSKPRFQDAILFAEKRDHVLLFTLAPATQHSYDKLKRRHGCSLRQSWSILCGTLRVRATGHSH
jgi:hypothetical protein